MKTLPIILTLALIMTVTLVAYCTSPVPNDQAVLFLPVRLFIDSHEQPLAAYQFELKTSANVNIVGIEAANHPAYPQPPYYDPAALMQQRIIIAAYSLAPNLPTGKTHLATLHLQITGDSDPQLTPELILAATENGETIPATITLCQGDQK